MDRLRQLQLLNDNMRTEFLGVVLFSRAFHEQSASFKQEALQRIRAYKKFGKGGHHDAGVILMRPSVRWRIEYFAPDMQGRSRNPLDPAQTMRVLVVELINEGVV